MIPKVELVKVEPTVKLEVSFEDAVLIHALLGSVASEECESVWRELGPILCDRDFNYNVYEQGGRNASLAVERVNY